MSDGRFERYNAKRDALIKLYKKKKLLKVTLTVAVGAAVFIAVMLLGDVLNIAVTLVIEAMTVMITVIAARLYAVTADYALERQMKILEQEEPEFHANFKR